MPATQSINSPGVFSNSHQWLLVSVATLCGLIAAYGIGKVPVAIPFVREEFSSSLSWSGALASSYSVIAMLFSVLFGVLVARIGSWRAGAAGLCFLATGGVLGALATTLPLLLLCRVIEGIGFVAIAVSMPAFIGSVCDQRNRPLAMGVWGTFVPGGVAISLLVSPVLLPIGGWRSLWWAGSVVAVGGMILIFYTLKPAAQRISGTTNREMPKIRSVLTRGPLILTACFAIYSATFVALTTFLPTLWTETGGMALNSATRLSALVVVMNILGNLTGGWLNSRGVAIRQVLLWALVGAGLCACIVYIDELPLAGQLLGAGACVFLGGMLPATLFASVSSYAPSQAHSGLILGLFFQGAGLGQVFGPVLFGATVDYFGSWHAAPVFFMVAIVIAVLLLWNLPGRDSPTK